METNHWKRRGKLGAIALASGALALAWPVAAQVAGNGGENPNATATAAGEVVELAPVEIVGTRPTRYDAGGAVALKLPVAAGRLPLSATALPEQLWLDQDARELNDVLRNVAGIAFSDGFGDTKEDYFLRGFRRDGNYHEDGYQVASQGKANLAAVERVEILKGPASLLFGRVAPGGIVNVVLKRPLDEARTYTDATFSDRGERRFLADFTGPLGHGWAYRAVAALEDSDSWKRGAHDIDKLYFSPMLRWGSANTTITAAISYSDQTIPFDRGAVFDRATVNEPGTIYYHYFGFGDDFFAYTIWRGSVEVQQQLAEGLRLSAKVAGERNSGEDQYSQIVKLSAANARLRSGNPNAPAGFYRYLRNNEDRDDTGLFAEARLDYELELGATQHQLFAGVSHSYTERNQSHVNQASVNGAYIDQTAVDLNAPNTAAHGRVLRRGDAGTYDLHEPQAENAFWIGDIATAGPVTLLAGLRWVDYDYKIEITPVTPPTLAASNADLPRLSQWLGQGGALLQVTRDWSAYVSFSESYLPQRLDDAGNTDINAQPRSSEQWEVGVKHSSRDGRLGLTLTAYQLEETNVPEDTGATDSLGRPIYRLIEGATVEGLEAEARVTFFQGLNLLASYAWLDSEQRTGANRGRELPVVSPHSASLWVSYERPLSQTLTLGLGSGAFYVHERQGNGANTLQIDGYTTYDLRAWLYWKEWKLKLGVSNVTNEEYIQGFAAIGDVATNNSNLNVGAPRTVTFGLSRTW